MKYPGAPSYEVFILGRILQGIGSSSLAIILAILRDCYEKEEERLKVLNSREMLESNMDTKAVVPLHSRGTMVSYKVQYCFLLKVSLELELTYARWLGCSLHLCF